MSQGRQDDTTQSGTCGAGRDIPRSVATANTSASGSNGMTGDDSTTSLVDDNRSRSEGVWMYDVRLDDPQSTNSAAQTATIEPTSASASSATAPQDSQRTPTQTHRGLPSQVRREQDSVTCLSQEEADELCDALAGNTDYRKDRGY